MDFLYVGLFLRRCILDDALNVSLRDIPISFDDLLIPKKKTRWTTRPPLSGVKSWDMEKKRWLNLTDLTKQPTMGSFKNDQKENH